MKINTYLPDKHKYLQMTATIAKSPLILHVSGTLPVKRTITVAIVGTRNPTQYGTQVTCEIADTLARKGVVIVSGLAYGIDAAAHTAALEANGTTIAVLAHGLDQMYPRGHEQLAKRITEQGGALITEYATGTGIRKHHFLERNRLVSGLADAVVVVEAGERSGTLSTVMHALEQGKDVFAVPGNITSPQSIGPNRLIQQGAHPVLSANDILTVVAPHLISQSRAAPTGTSPEESLLIQLIINGVREAEALQTASGLSASIFMQTLTMLEIQGVIYSPHSNYWTVKE